MKQARSGKEIHSELSGIFEIRRIFEAKEKEKNEQKKDGGQPGVGCKANVTLGKRIIKTMIEAARTEAIDSNVVKCDYVTSRCFG